MQRRSITSSMGDVCSLQTVLDILGVVIRGGKQHMWCVLSHQNTSLCHITSGLYALRHTTPVKLIAMIIILASKMAPTIHVVERMLWGYYCIFFFVIGKNKKDKKKKTLKYLRVEMKTLTIFQENWNLSLPSQTAWFRHIHSEDGHIGFPMVCYNWKTMGNQVHLKPSVMFSKQVWACLRPLWDLQRFFPTLHLQDNQCLGGIADASIQVVLHIHFLRAKSFNSIWQQI